MERRNKHRKNRGKFQSNSNDKKLKEECVNVENTECCAKTDVTPTTPAPIAVCSDETFKPNGDLMVSEGTGLLESNVVRAHAGEKFPKRKVVSNWGRYEEDDGIVEESELCVKKGTDFSDLAESSSGATSFFRFKDELEWEDQPIQSTGAEFLSLNCRDLASALLCVPMPARLLIKEELFPKKILKKLDAAAKSHEKQYVTEKALSPAVSREVVSHTTQLLLDTYSDKTMYEDLEEQSCKPDNDAATFTWATCDETSLDDNVVPSSDKEVVSVDAMDTAVVPCILSDSDRQSSNVPSNISPAKTVPAEEDDLEFLLSLPTSQSGVTTEPEAMQSGDHQQEAKVELKSVSKPEVKLFEESSPQNLEDWLDSVLDE